MDRTTGSTRFPVQSTEAPRRTSHFPEMQDVETPLGVAEMVWATSATHIGVRGEFTVNRVTYSIRLDLHLRDGEWQEGDKDSWDARYHALMMNRQWDYPGGKPRPDVSSAARTKTRDALLPWLIAFAKNEGAEIVREAGTLDHQRKIAAKQAEIEKLRTEIEESERELQALQAVR